MDRLLAIDEVRQRVGNLGQSTLYRLVQLGQFPKPVPLGVGNRVAWREADVQQWVSERIAAAQALTEPKAPSLRKSKRAAEPA
jgi:prophage regulatory protein